MQTEVADRDDAVTDAPVRCGQEQPGVHLDELIVKGPHIRWVVNVVVIEEHTIRTPKRDGPTRASKR